MVLAQSSSSSLDVASSLVFNPDVTVDSCDVTAADSSRSVDDCEVFDMSSDDVMELRFLPSDDGSESGVRRICEIGSSLTSGLFKPEAADCKRRSLGGKVGLPKGGTPYELDVLGRSFALVRACDVTVGGVHSSGSSLLVLTFVVTSALSGVSSADSTLSSLSLFSEHDVSSPSKPNTSVVFSSPKMSSSAATCHERIRVKETLTQQLNLFDSEHAPAD